MPEHGMAIGPDLQIDALTRGLERHFRHVQRTRMADVPILNPALTVQAVGFRRIDNGLFGALITPWFISLVILPSEGDDWCDRPIGSHRSQRFASGSYEFLMAMEEPIGRYQTCSLLSPVLEIGDQATAVEVARAALQAIDDPECRDASADTHAAEIERRWHGDTDTEVDERQASNPSSPEGLTEVPLSRRDFLRGRRGSRQEPNA